MNKNNSLYQTKLMIDVLCKQSFTKENLSLLDLQFKNIIFLLEKNSENEELFEFIEGFYSTFVRLLKLDINFLEEIRLEIYKTFSIIWELIVTYNFYKDFKLHDVVSINRSFDLRKSVLKEIATVYIFHLQDYLQDLPLSNKIDDELIKFKGIQAV